MTTWTPPYVAVIFASRRTGDDRGYAQMTQRMQELAGQQPGFLGIDSVSEGGRGLTVSYWRDEESSLAWRGVAEHVLAQRLGRERWYADYDLHVAVVTRTASRQPREPQE